MPMFKHTQPVLGPISERNTMKTILRSVLWVALSIAHAGCVTVRPQERAVLADPLMRFDADARREAQLEHVLDNREGSFGGGAVQGGGCGCN